MSSKATCTLARTDYGTLGVAGTLSFEVDAAGSPRVFGTVTGLPPSSTFGLHIHEFGHIGPQPGVSTITGLATGGHYNPTGAPHGLPPATRMCIYYVCNIF